MKILISTFLSVQSSQIQKRIFPNAKLLQKYQKQVHLINSEAVNILENKGINADG